MHPGFRTWGRDHKAQQRKIRQGLFRSRLSNYYHGQFSRASHPAPMSYFSFLNFKWKKKNQNSKAIHVYGRKWKNIDKQIEENYTTHNPATKALLTTYKSFQICMCFPLIKNSVKLYLLVCSLLFCSVSILETVLTCKWMFFRIVYNVWIVVYL